MYTGSVAPPGYLNLQAVEYLGSEDYPALGFTPSVQYVLYATFPNKQIPDVFRNPDYKQATAVDSQNYSYFPNEHLQLIPNYVCKMPAAAKFFRGYKTYPALADNSTHFNFTGMMLKNGDDNTGDHSSVDFTKGLRLFLNNRTLQGGYSDGWALCATLRNDVGDIRVVRGNNVGFFVTTVVNTAPGITVDGNTGACFIHSGNTQSTSTTTGALVIDKGLGIGGNAYIGGDVVVTGTIPGYMNTTSMVGANLVFVGGQLKATSAFANDVTTTSTTPSTSTYSGCIIGAGGLGIGGDANILGYMAIGDTLTVNSTTDATTTPSTAASFKTAGGAVVAKDLIVGGALTVSGSGTSTFASTTDATSVTAASLVAAGGVAVTKNLIVGGALTVSSTTDATSVTAASLVAAGGVGIALNLFVGGTLVNTKTNDSTSTGSGSFQTQGGIGVAKNAYIGGQLHVLDATNASATTNGSGVFAGGLGVAKKSYFGGIMTLTDLTDSTSTTNGTLVVGGGIGAAGNIYVGGKIVCSDTTDSSTTTTGAALFSGGVGIVKSVSIGG